MYPEDCFLIKKKIKKTCSYLLKTSEKACSPLCTPLLRSQPVVVLCCSYADNAVRSEECLVCHYGKRRYGEQAVQVSLKSTLPCLTEWRTIFYQSNTMSHEYPAVSWHFWSINYWFWWIDCKNNSLLREIVCLSLSFSIDLGELLHSQSFVFGCFSFGH